MTTPAHGAMAGIIAYSIYSNPLFVTVAVILAILPDVQRVFQKDKDDWGMYNKLHSIKLWWYVPFWNIHIILDYFMHDKITGKWYSWVYPFEILFWILFIIGILCYI